MQLLYWTFSVRHFILLVCCIIIPSAHDIWWIIDNNYIYFLLITHKLNRKLSILTLLLFYSLYITTSARMAHRSDCGWCCFPGIWMCASSSHICYLQMEEWVMSFILNSRIILQYNESEIGRVWPPGSPPSILNSLVFGVIIIPISIKCANK